VGLVDAKTIRLAKKLGIFIQGGSLSKKSGRVRINTNGKFPGAMRSRVVWWLNTGEIIVGKDVDIHHKNTIKSDDRFSNLEKLNHVEHSHHHNPKGLKLVEFICIGCGNRFKLDGWRAREGGRGKFCSLDCYWKQPRKSSKIEKLCEECGKSFWINPARTSTAKCCSYSCLGKSNARLRWSA
jgi:hypothetical protein